MLQKQETKKERIAKIMARAGQCSRREAEVWIAQGRVRVNGSVIKTPATLVGPEDEIAVDGKPIQKAERTRLFLYHKPAGLVTTRADEMGRKTVFDNLPSSLPRVVSIGRLDLNSEGLLLLTNDGGLARYLELPKTGWRRRYRVRVHGTVDTAKLSALGKGLTIEGVRYKPIDAKIEKAEQGQKSSNTWLSVTLTEGKNREIRRVMESIGLKVNRLVRVSFGPFNLDTLAAGGVIEVPQKILTSQIPAYFKKDS